MTTHTGKAAYVYDGVLSGHVLREGHPMCPVRLRHTYALLRAYGAFEDEHALLVPPRPATLDELTTFHTEEYVETVRRLSSGEEADGDRHGFAAHGDNPVYPGMYEAALLSTGASVQAAELVAGQRGVVGVRSGGWAAPRDARVGVRFLHLQRPGRCHQRSAQARPARGVRGRRTRTTATACRLPSTATRT